MCLFKNNIKNKKFLHFPNLAIFEKLHEDDILIYIDHLTKLHNNMEIRFKDLQQMKIPNWVIDLFGTNAADVDIILKENLSE